jgi:undecaprenyl-diphosphatase
VASWVTLLGSPGVVIVLGFAVAAAAWFRLGSRAWGLACLAAPGIAGVGESTLKFLIARPRPVTAALTGEDGNGFPSGHAAGFCAFVCIVAFALSNRAGTKDLQPKGRGNLRAVLAFTATAIMALTRVLIGAHYPIDVVAGVLVGFVAADVVALLAKSLDNVTIFGLPSKSPQVHEG